MRAGGLKRANAALLLPPVVLKLARLVCITVRPPVTLAESGGARNETRAPNGRSASPSCSCFPPLIKARDNRRVSMGPASGGHFAADKFARRQFGSEQTGAKQALNLSGALMALQGRAGSGSGRKEEAPSRSPSRHELPVGQHYCRTLHRAAATRPPANRPTACCATADGRRVPAASASAIRAGAMRLALKFSVRFRVGSAELVRRALVESGRVANYIARHYSRWRCMRNGRASI